MVKFVHDESSRAEGNAALSADSKADIRPGRLTAEAYAAHFADRVPPLTEPQALLEASRCLYCYDAPCMHACPTGIDVPSFIKRIAEDNVRGAAQTILGSNPLGGFCARDCPTEVLCEQVCVRNVQQGRPVAIGRLQRYAVDRLMASASNQIFERAPSTGRRVAVVGAGPAGLACAHALARAGHAVTLHDARPKAGGLNEYGVAAYKTVDDYAQREVAWLLALGGITLQCGWALRSADQLQELRRDYDAVFLGLGLADTHQLGIAGETLAGVIDAVEFIGILRQAPDPGTVPVGRRVLVIGGGMTAVDAAVQSKLLGAERVEIIYRRGPQDMRASTEEQNLARTRGVGILYWLAPLEVLGEGGSVTGMRFARQQLVGGQLAPTGEERLLEADMVLKAIGQRLGNPVLAQCGLVLRDGRIAVDECGRTSVAGVWAGGDCIAEGRDLTVDAVAHGLRAARDIDLRLSIARTRCAK
ncbi:MAG: NAD(P)-dependent oxidoreductase [Gammaproteobacteria bacterium]|nr:NAD(P)-dependent oxidoreductase [Gammaproteobacteria bacterium]